MDSSTDAAAILHELQALQEELGVQVRRLISLDCSCVNI
jgi:hypothetical protein